MEVVIVGLLPVLFLMLAASMLVVSQLTGFFQFGKYSQRRRQDRREIQDFMTQLAVAQSQVQKRSTQLEKVSARLRVSNEELERLNSMKSKFLSMAVHDVRTPLASIKGFGEMLSRQVLEGTQKKYVDYIVRGTDQINRLMSDLTDLAVIEAGKLRLEKASFDLPSMLKDIVPAIGVIAEKNGVEFVTPESPPEVIIVGDRFRLVQALMNFLNNAVKFTPAGGRVELKVAVIGRKVTLSVKDTGPGIHPSERGRVFEKFYQSQFQGIKERKKGWGLGLAIAQEIVRGHQGEIGLDSPGLGKGATFWFRIPTKPARLANGRRLLNALLLALCLAAPLSAQTIPLEEKAKFEHAMEAKAESVLLRLLGPSRYRVVVDATLDFTRIERFDVQGGAATSEAEPGSVFLWQNVGAEAAGRSELLPGIPMPEPVPGFGGAKSYERQNSFPTSFVKRLVVTLILDNTIAVEQGDELSRIVADILEVRPDRGDTLTIVRAPFAPAWKTIWYQPEAMSLLFKYVLITMMTLVTLIVVAICFLKLAEAMDSMAQAQSHQMQMEFGQGGGAEAVGEGAGGEGGAGGGGGEAGAAEPGNKIFFEVKAEQVDTLVEILQRQDPENVALVVAHLRPDVKRAFLSKLPTPVYSEVVLHLGSIRFVEPDLVATVKDELERRLESAVGGRSYLLEMIEQADMKAKRDILKLLETRDLELARLARSRVLLFEDLQFLEPRDWSFVLGTVKIEDWAMALHHAEEAMREAARRQMLPKTWAILEQMMEASRPSESVCEQAQERVVEAVMQIITDGVISNPVPRGMALEAERATSPPLDEAVEETAIEAG
ncbi:MAG: ATP-binding protein [Elusimicrobiota bacterium]